MAPVHETTSSPAQTVPALAMSDCGHLKVSHPTQCKTTIGTQSITNVAIPIQLVKKFACSAVGNSTGRFRLDVGRVDDAGKRVVESEREGE
jgi:hypothetical protein